MNKQITINNSTNSDIIVTCLNNNYSIIPATSKTTIVLPANEDLRIFQKKKQSSKFSIGQFFMKDSLRNIWLFSVVLTISLDTIVSLPNGIKHIDITEKKYHYWMYTIFNLLTVNEKSFKMSYQFHSDSDRKKFEFLSALYLFPIFIISLMLFMGTAYGIFCEFDFSFESILVYLLFVVCICVFIGLIKTVHKFKNLSTYSKEIIKNSKPIKIIKKSNHYIKYSELDIK